MKVKYIKLILIIILAIIAVILPLYEMRPPSPVLFPASMGVFSAERAMNHVLEIAQKPHPSGTEENIAVRDYIIERLKLLGLNPRIQETYINSRRYQGRIDNIIAVLKGKNGDSKKKIMIVSHYDSVPEGPGASDDAVAIAAMLESLRALSSSQLQNDIVFLFTDGEEINLLGAKAFMQEDPLAKDIGLVLNFEARGTSGPSIMFETRENNGRLIQEFAKAAPYPVANSFSYEIYKLMPNNTDFTIFKNYGIPGLNFAFISSSMNYHTKFDNIENVKLGTLQHHGSYALSLLKHFGDMDMENIDLNTPDQVYFDIPGKIMVHYPVSWVIPMLVIILALLAFFIYLKRKKLSLKGIMFSMLYISFSIVLMLIANSIFKAVLAFILSKADTIYNIYPYYKVSMNYSYYINPIFAFFIALTLTTLILGFYVFRRFFKITVHKIDLLITTLIIWAIISSLCSYLIPGASYLFTLPLLLALLFSFISYPVNRLSSTAKLSGSNKIDKAIIIKQESLISILLMSIGLFFLFPITYLINQALGLGVIAVIMILILLPLFPVVPDIVGAFVGEGIEKEKVDISDEL